MPGNTACNNNYLPNLSLSFVSLCGQVEDLSILARIGGGGIEPVQTGEKKCDDL